MTHSDYNAIQETLVNKTLVTQWRGACRDHSERVYYPMRKEIDVDLRRLEKIHCECVIV